MKYFLMQGQKAKIFISIVAFIAWFALAAQFYILVSNVPSNGMSIIEAIGRFFIFFTILTNLMVAISLTTLLLKPHSTAGRFFSNPIVVTAVAVYIFIVGLVYNIILRAVWQPEGLQKLVDELLHVAVPLLFVSYWLFVAPKRSLEWVHAFRWLIFPALYLIYALTRGHFEGFYPYPFINAAELPFGKVFTNSFGLLLVFVAVGLLFVFVGKKLER